tara:strand:+ start:39 stop:332 length:294 start_codon:yes stop_codon:yes gene_type:complete
MADMDIINSLADEPIRPPEFVKLETIINEVPCMSVNNPTAFYLYLYYNDKFLTDEEKSQVNKIIHKLKTERDAATQKNIDYLDRWKTHPIQNEVIKE